MKSLLAGIGLPKAIGLYVDQGAVHLSQVVATPWGPVEIARYSQNAGADELADVLRRLLAPLRGRRWLRRVPVAIGLPPAQTYFSTRPIQNASSDVSPHVLLREALRSTSVCVDEMVVDVIKTQPDKRMVASIASCDQKYLTELLGSLGQCGVRPHRAEPAPCALLRVAASKHRSGRNAKVVLRLILGETQALALLVANNLPLVWRSFSLPRGDEGSALLSVSRSLQTMSRLCGVESPLDAVIVHGRPDLPRLLGADWVQQEMGARVKWCDGPALDDSQVAFGLALGCLRDFPLAFDLARSLKPRASLQDVFPLRQAVLQAALLVGMTVLLATRSASLNDSYLGAQAENAQHPWMASLQTSQLGREKTQLLQKVAAVHRFLNTRITWTCYGRELAACLPAHAFLTSFQGVSELGLGGTQAGKAKPKKSLVLHGAASIPQDGSMPREIDRFLDRLREHPKLKRDFPVVELAGLKQARRTGDDTPVAFFTVVCVPKTAKGTPK
jgi:hypothetical protein